MLADILTGIGTILGVIVSLWLGMRKSNVRLTNIENRISAIEKALNGNGQKGIFEQLYDLSQRTENNKIEIVKLKALKTGGLK